MGKVGRPSIAITEEIIKEAEALSSRGLTNEQIADCIGLGERTLYEKFEAYPQLAQAIKAGRAKGIKVIANSLFEAAKLGNITAQIFYLKCRAKWRELDPEENDKEQKVIEIAKDEVKKLKADKHGRSTTAKD